MAILEGIRTYLEVSALCADRTTRPLLDEFLKTRDLLEQELRLSEERFRTFMNNAPFVTFVKDAEGRFLYYNERMAQRFGIAMEEWLGKSDFDVWPKEIADTIHLNDMEAITSGQSIERLEETMDGEGRLTTWKVHRFSWRDERGEVRIGGIGLDLSEEIAREKALAEANLQLARLAATDTLTGLSNRRILDERVEYEYRLARRHKSALSVVLLDIDNFKLRNDAFGHASGDKVLKMLGELINSTLRATDVAARYGGEEFVVLLPGANSDGARIFAERLRERIRKIDWPDGPVTASFGTAALEATTTTGRRLIELADRAMYEAKRTGKDRVVDFHGIPMLSVPGTRAKISQDA